MIAHIERIMIRPTSNPIISKRYKQHHMNAFRIVNLNNRTLKAV